MSKFDRFNEGPPDLEHRGQAEREDEGKTLTATVNECLRPTMAVQPVESLEDTIAKFNVAFGQSFNVNGEYSRTTLTNMAMHAMDKGMPELSYLLTRHAEIAERIV
jgi:hypothetical protein